MRVVRALLTAATAITLTACGAEPVTTPTPPPVPPSSWETTTPGRPSTSPAPAVPGGVLTFEVYGSYGIVADAISYGVGPATITLRDVQLPWSATVNVPPGDAVSVTVQAQLAADMPNTVRCRIARDDQELDTDTQQWGALCTALLMHPAVT